MAGTSIKDEDEIDWLIRSLRNELESAEDSDNANVLHLSLTLTGWQRYYELLRSPTRSRQAFMAMKFGDPTLEDVRERVSNPQPSAPVSSCEVDRRSGRRTYRQPNSGRHPRQSLLMADLTHDNLGAYWKVGYAEGLGKPVIYSCRKSRWDEKKTHFDTNHMNT